MNKLSTDAGGSYFMLKEEKIILTMAPSLVVGEA